MKKVFSLTMLWSAFLLVSCSQSAKSPIDSKDIALETRSDSFAPPAEQNTGNDGLDAGARRFIRRADMRFKVRQVSDAVAAIERTTRSLGGFITLSHFQNNVLDSTETVISADSSLQKLTFSTEGYITLRVPDNRLDSLLELLEPLASVMGKREVSSEDVRFKILTNRLNRKRSLKAGERLATDIDQKGKKLQDISDAENLLEAKEVSRDEALIANLTLNDAVEYSTVSVAFYQDAEVRYAVRAREKQIGTYQPSLLSRLREATVGGWEVFQDLLIFIVRIWPVGLIVIASWFTYNRYARGAKSAAVVRTHTN